MKQNIVRCDLDRCYRFNEYNEAIAYAKKNIEIKGVREEAGELEREKAIYIKDVESITNPAREEEEKNILHGCRTQRQAIFVNGYQWDR